MSVRSHHWVNRGFLRGPMLPIYGCGAIVILFLTLPVRDSIPLIYLFGMIGATVLEYVTGVLMEKLFGVRYWDYSQKPFNLKGHICLGCSLGWGVFSVLLVKYLHLPVEKLVLKIPESVTQCISFAVLVVFVIDFTTSFQAAMDLKELLHSLKENNEELRRLQKRLDVVIAVLDSDREELKERIEERVEQSKEKLEQGMERLEEQSRMRIEQSMERLESQSREWRELSKERLEQSLRRYAGKLEELELIYRERYEQRDSEENRARDEKKEKLRVELEELREKMRQMARRLPELPKRKDKGIRDLLKRNPSAVSKSFQAWLDELKSDNFDKKDKE